MHRLEIIMRTLITSPFARRAALALTAVAAAVAMFVLPLRSARASYDVADSGSWSLSLCTGTLGGGQACVGSGDISIQDGYEWPDFTQISYEYSSDFNLNDMVNSYVVCNNTSSGHDFYAKVYTDINLQNEFQSNTLQLPAYACALVNLTETNTASSITVAP
jgi:hypothetical protein